MVEDTSYESATGILLADSSFRQFYVSDHKTVFLHDTLAGPLRVTVLKELHFPGNPPLTLECILPRSVQERENSMVLLSAEYALVILILSHFQSHRFSINTSNAAFFTTLLDTPTFSRLYFTDLLCKYQIKKYACFIFGSIRCCPSLFYKFPDIGTQISTSAFLRRILRRLPLKIQNVLFYLLFVSSPCKSILRAVVEHLTRHVKKKLRTYYKTIIRKIAKPVIVDAEIKAFEIVAQPLNKTPKKITSIDKAYEPVLFTTNTGLWLFRNTTIRQLASGYYWGLTRLTGTTWLVYQQVGNFGRLLSFRLPEHQPREMFGTYMLQTGLPEFIHQIDSYDGDLFLTDTRNNRVIHIDNTRQSHYFYPNGHLSKGNDSPNYNHFNSLFITQKDIFLLANNNTQKSKRTSQVFVIDRTTMNVRDVLPLGNGGAHNCIPYKGALLYCDSLHGGLRHGTSTLFQDPSFFTRGVSLTRSSLILGGSGYAERTQRFGTDCIIWFLDFQGNILSSHLLKGIGQIHEIRAIDGDFGLSQNTGDFVDIHNEHT